MLLHNHADINLPDPDGVSPLLLAIMNANWDLAKQLIEAGADINQWDMFGEAPLFTAVGLRNQVSGGRASIDPLNETKGITIVRTLLEHGANPNIQLFFRPANVKGTTNTRAIHSADPGSDQCGYGSDEAAVGARRGRDPYDGRSPDAYSWQCSPGRHPSHRRSR